MSYIKSRKGHSTPKSLCKSGLSTAMFASLISGTVYAAGTAQAASSEQDVELSEVVVIGNENASELYYQKQLGSTKFTDSIAKTPKTVQVIDSSILKDQHATSLSDALRNSPGIGTFSLGEGGNTTSGDAIFMRGFDTSGSIYINGARDSGNYSRDTFNIEQVEVTKGSDGAAYGRTSPSGGVNLVTKQAHLKNQHEANVSVGTDEQKRLTLDLNQQINDTTAVRLNLLGEKSGVPGRDVLENKSWGVAPAIAFGLGTDMRMKVDYLHLQQNNIPDGGVTTIGLKGWMSPDRTQPEFDNAPAVKNSNFYGSTSDYDDVTVDTLTVLFEKDIGLQATFHNTTRVGRTQQDYLLTNISANAVHGSWVANDFANWQIGSSGHALDQTNTIYTNQTGIVQDLDVGRVRHTLSYGLELTREKVEVVGKTAAGFGDVSVYNPSHNAVHSVSKSGADSEGTTDTVAAYIFDSIKLGEDWQINAGVRFDRYQADYKALALCDDSNSRAPDCNGAATGTPVATVNQDTKKNLFTWQLGTLYQITDEGNVYLSYSVSEQPPGSNGLVLASKENSDNPKYDPQKSATAEFGTKWSLVDDKLLLSAAVFRTEVTNQVEQDPVSMEYHQDGEKRVQGFELSVIGNITDNWNASLGYSQLSSKVTKGANASGADDGSADLPFSPSNSFTSWTTYKLPFGLIIGGGARYTGSMARTLKGNTTPSEVDSYWITDLMASYAFNRNLSAQLNVYNLFDEDYVAQINRNGYRYTPGQSRTALLGVNYKF